MHGGGISRSEFQGLARGARICGERLDDDPVEFEAADYAAEIAGEGVGGDETFPLALALLSARVRARGGSVRRLLPRKSKVRPSSKRKFSMVLKSGRSRLSQMMGRW